MQGWTRLALALARCHGYLWHSPQYPLTSQVVRTPAACSWQRQRQSHPPWLLTVPTFPQTAKYRDLVECPGTQHLASLLLGSWGCRKHHQPFLAVGGWTKPEKSLADANSLSWQDSRTNFRGSLNLNENKTPHHCHHSRHPPFRTKASMKVQPNKPVQSQTRTQTCWRRALDEMEEELLQVV